MRFLMFFEFLKNFIINIPTIFSKIKKKQNKFEHLNNMFIKYPQMFQQKFLENILTYGFPKTFGKFSN